MAKLLKLRRGTTTQHGSFTGELGEVTVDTDKTTLVVHPGGTEGGGEALLREDLNNMPNSGVTAGTYGSSSAIPAITVDAKGLVTSATTSAIDSTAITNGTSNVSVAASGNITTTRSGTTRLTVDDAGVEVNGTFDVGGGNVAVTRTSGQLTAAFTATASNSVIEIGGSTGAFLDLKSPDSDDFDLRLGSTGTGGFIQCASGNLTITGSVVPVADNTYDLGTSSTEWRDAYFDGTVTTDALTVDGTSTFTGDVTFNGSTSAITLGSGSDIRFPTSGAYTGDGVGIQHHNNYLYVGIGTSGIIFREGNTDRCMVDGAGHFRPSTNNTYDLGTSSLRWRNVYTNDLNLSNEGNTNDVDGTWGSWTIQEGEDDLFLLNRRNGKKYKFNLSEVN